MVLYTNDVHCAIDDNIGYAGVMAYKNEMLEQTPYVTLVDAGDAIQGGFAGLVSEGEYIVDIMNDVGYDYAVLGNHEFDYGLEQLSYLVKNLDASVLGCNILYSGTKDSFVSDIAPYSISEYGDVLVGFIGVSTPYSMTSSGTKYFMENDGYVYDFYGESGEALYGCVQGYIDECREDGADYVILVTHLGDRDNLSPFSSVDLIENTTGVDVVIDGHAHSTIPCQVELNLDGDEVILTTTGTKLNNIGKLTIDAKGNIVAELISDYENKDSDVETLVENIKATYDSELNETITSNNTALSCYDENGARIVRCRETTIGDFCADAFREVAGADIAFINGGGIRADLPSGDISYGDVLNVFPFGNTLCMIEAGGQQILDALEYGAGAIDADGDENAGFLQVSGIRYCIDLSADENRIYDVEVLGDDGEYVPLDASKSYKLASNNYLLLNGGDGFSMFSDDDVLIESGMVDYELIMYYIKEVLCGDLSRYENIEGRIVIK